MEILIGFALSLSISIGKKLGLSKKESIQYVIIFGSIIFSAISYYADSSSSLKQYLTDIIIIASSAIATYELITKKIKISGIEF